MGDFLEMKAELRTINKRTFASLNKLLHTNSLYIDELNKWAMTTLLKKDLIKIDKDKIIKKKNFNLYFNK
jgi:hypothetical protein